MKFELCSGAVLYTWIGSVLHYVLVREKSGNCGLPKGHIEMGETKKEAALREIYEETGIRARLSGDFSATISYRLHNGNMKKVTYYIASFENQTPRSDPRECPEVYLLPYEEALKKLSYSSVKNVLCRANNYLCGGRRGRRTGGEGKHITQ